MDKKCITRLTAQAIHFLSITQPENNLSVSINFCRCFLTGSLYIQSFSFVLCGYPQIKYGEMSENKNSRQRFSWFTSASVSPEELREGSWLYRFLRWYIKYCCLSVYASSVFYVSYLAKFCTSWYFRIFELNHVQMIIHRNFLTGFIIFFIPFSLGILYHLLICP